jgi:hypothetical protein
MRVRYVIRWSRLTETVAMAVSMAALIAVAARLV